MASEWPRVPVSTICDIYLGGTPRRSEPSYWDGAIKWASAADVAGCSIRYLYETSETITEKGLQESAAKLTGRDTIVITARGTVGALCMLSDPMAFNQTCYGLVAKDKVVPGYLYYALKAVLSQIHSLSYGTVFNTITMKSFDSLQVPFPSLKVQQAIAHILGTLDDKIELNRRMNETLEGIARAIFKSWFVDFDPARAKVQRKDAEAQRRKEKQGQDSFASWRLGGSALNPAIADLFPDAFEASELGEIPKGWEMHALPDILDINPPRQLSRGTLAPYLAMSGMPTQGHAPDSWIEREVGSGMKFKNGDTLVARITPCLENGKTAYVDFLGDGEIGWGSTEYIVLRPREPVPTIFAYLLARSNKFRAFAVQQMTGSSGRQRVPADSLAQYEIVVPAANSPVFTTFGQAVNPLFERIRSGMEQSRTFATLRDTLLPKLISGELRIPDAERIVGRCV